VSGYNSKSKETVVPAAIPLPPSNLNGNTKVTAPFMFNQNKKPLPPKFDAEEELEIDFGPSSK